MINEFKCKDLKELDLKSDNTPILINLYQINAGRTNVHFEDMEQIEIDLRKHLIKNFNTTRLFEVVSGSLEPEIRKDDLLLIDQRIAAFSSSKQLDNKIVACIFEGEGLVKRYKHDGNFGTLLSLNHEYKPIVMNEYSYFQVWGVTTFLIRNSANFFFDDINLEKINELNKGLESIEDLLYNKEISLEERVFKIKNLLKNIKT
ncbi:MAG: S24 family peptidase [Candidatus Sericytochromatia bacterium]